MSFALTRINIARNVKTRVFTDPDQYDTEINAARGMHLKKTTQRSRYSPPMDEASHLIDNFRTPVSTDHVTRGEVIDAQNFWAQSIIDISTSFLTGGDYVGLAGDRAGELYGYDHSNVLFKPTKAAQKQFRPTANDAMSYFVGHDAIVGGFKEDQGFAINAKKGFSKVVFDNHQIDCHNEVAHAMGTYEFTCATTGEISEVEYTFGYKRNPDGKVRICLHHSSIPYESSNPVREAKPYYVKHKIAIDPDQADPEANERYSTIKRV
jgi:hypothetical protein